MLPEKRRAGRAVRKHRREVRRIMESPNLLTEALTSFVRALEHAVKVIMELLAPVIAAFLTTRRQDLYWQRRNQAAFSRSEPPMGYPSHSGGGPGDSGAPKIESKRDRSDYYG